MQYIGQHLTQDYFIVKDSGQSQENLIHLCFAVFENIQIHPLIYFTGICENFGGIKTIGAIPVQRAAP
jgi:hypothetical protein